MHLLSLGRAQASGQLLQGEPVIVYGVVVGGVGRELCVALGCGCQLFEAVVCPFRQREWGWLGRPLEGTLQPLKLHQARSTEFSTGLDPRKADRGDLA